MGFMDRFLSYMKLNGDEDYDDEYDNDEYDDYDEEPERKVSKISSRKAKSVSAEDEEDRPKKASPKITPIKQVRRGNGAGMEVCVIKPTSIEDGREITETLLANRTVVLNLEGLDVDIAQRIIDFTSGSCFAISGNLQKISQYIFIITPASVDISGDFQDIFNGSVDVPGFH
ncbi:MAG TPA: cell division protein SepF [Candidatus Eisenbergiella intestinipullorum]|nr:cell division protein SepF [Candidatus Eisenbergiella intestinipullorum]